MDFGHLCLCKGFVRKYFTVYMVLVNELKTKYEITRMIVFSYINIFMLVSILSLIILRYNSNSGILEMFAKLFKT